MIKACLNGGHAASAHPNLPITPPQLAAQAQACVAAGAGAIHAHPRDNNGAQSFDPEHIAAAVLAMRAACPSTPIGLSTLYSILPDPHKRANMISRWTAKPDFVSVNFGEPGTQELCQALQQQGIGIEAGLDGAEATRAYIASGYRGKCVRILLEPDGGKISDVLEQVLAIEILLDQAGDTTPRLLHSDGPITWALLDIARQRGYDSRIGLEDVLSMPDGSQAVDNAAMLRVATNIQHQRSLLLIRHAAPQIDREQAAHTWFLSEEGRASCTSLSDVLESLGPLTFFSSHEPKARETAELTAARLGAFSTAGNNLHEHHRSGVEWMGDAAFQAALTLFFRRPQERVFGLETAEQAGSRFENAINMIVESAAPGNLAIVAHGTVITLLTARHNQIQSYEFWKQLAMPAIVALRVPGYKLAWVAPCIGRG